MKIQLFITPDKKIEIMTHVEPRNVDTKTHSHEYRELSLLEKEKIQGEIRKLIESYRDVKKIGDINIYLEDELLFAGIDIEFEESMNIRQVHQITEQIEGVLYANIPNLSRIVIHTEPLKEKINH